MVTQRLPKPWIAGSNPVSRFFPFFLCFSPLFFRLFEPFDCDLCDIRDGSDAILDAKVDTWEKRSRVETARSNELGVEWP